METNQDMAPQSRKNVISKFMPPPYKRTSTQASCRSIIDFRIERQNKPASRKPPKRKTSLPSVHLAILKLDIN